MKKVMNFDQDVSDMAQSYANENHNGNFTAAVDELLRGALLSDKLAKATERHKAKLGTLFPNNDDMPRTKGKK